MKSSPDIELVSQESLPIVCRATVSHLLMLAASVAASWRVDHVPYKVQRGVVVSCVDRV